MKRETRKRNTNTHTLVSVTVGMAVLVSLRTLRAPNAMHLLAGAHRSRGLNSIGHGKWYLYLNYNLILLLLDARCCTLSPLPHSSHITIVAWIHVNRRFVHILHANGENVYEYDDQMHNMLFVVPPPTTVLHSTIQRNTNCRRYTRRYTPHGQL